MSTSYKRVKVENTEVIFKSQIQPPIPYRIYYISKEGIHLSGTPIRDRFPWENAQKVARRILRAWARDLVARHDAAQLGAILSQWAKDWTTKDGVAEVDPSIIEPSPAKHLLSRLRNNTIERRAYFAQRYGRRDDSVIFHLSEEMIEAVGYCLIKIIIKPQTDEHRFSLYRTMWDQLFREED